LFEDRQAVHIGTQGDDWPRFAAHQGPDHTGVGDAGLDFIEPEIPQVLGDLRRGPEFTIRELRVLVQVTPPFDDFRFDRRERPVQAVLAVLCQSSLRSCPFALGRSKSNAEHKPEECFD
jgi:hypothetical protein